MACFVDVNVLVALFHERHQFSERAIDWLNTQDAHASIAICRVVQLGVLRILTRPSIMKQDVLSAKTFWRGWDKLMVDDRFALVDEPPSLSQTWRALSTSFPKGQCAETDVYLAAFAIARGDTLISFDAGFKKFANLSFELLSGATAN